MWIIKQNTSEKGLPQAKQNQKRKRRGKNHIRSAFSFITLILFSFVIEYSVSQLVSQEVTEKLKFFLRLFMFKA